MVPPVFVPPVFVPPVFVVVMGVSGSGKTTVGELLAERMGWRFYDGDKFHPPENVAKMAAGTPLDDTDRAGWLAVLAGVMRTGLRAARAASSPARPSRRSIVTTCGWIQPACILCISRAAST